MDLGIHLPITDPTWIFFLVLMIILFAPILAFAYSAYHRHDFGWGDNR